MDTETTRNHSCLSDAVFFEESKTDCETEYQACVDSYSYEDSDALDFECDDFDISVCSGDVTAADLAVCFDDIATAEDKDFKAYLDVATCDSAGDDDAVEAFDDAYTFNELTDIPSCVPVLLACPALLSM